MFQFGEFFDFWAWIILFIIISVVYWKTKRVYNVMYGLSVFTYAVLISYAIDAFQLEKNGILGLLAISAVIMIAIGLYIKREKESTQLAKPAQTPPQPRYPTRYKK